VRDAFWPLSLLVLGCGIGSFFWRGLGVWVADRIDVESDWFRWITCVAFAIIAGLMARVVILPVGELAHTTLSARLLGVALALLAFRLTRRSLLLGVLTGAVSLPLLGFLGWG